jgi:hypothetical protein
MVEIIAVIVILGVIAGSALPVLTTLSSVRTGAAAGILRKDVSRARETAVATGRRVWVRFSGPTASYSMWIETWASPGLASTVPLVDLATGLPIQRQLGQGEYAGVVMQLVNFDGGSDLGFDWLGRPLNSSEASLVSSGSIELATAQGTNVQGIRVTKGTGAITD